MGCFLAIIYSMLSIFKSAVKIDYQFFLTSLIYEKASNDFILISKLALKGK